MSGGRGLERGKLIRIILLRDEDFGSSQSCWIIF